MWFRVPNLTHVSARKSVLVIYVLPMLLLASCNEGSHVKAEDYTVEQIKEIYIDFMTQEYKRSKINYKSIPKITSTYKYIIGTEKCVEIMEKISSNVEIQRAFSCTTDIICKDNKIRQSRWSYYIIDGVIELGGRIILEDGILRNDRETNINCLREDD
jgi:hypothetical protein